MPSASPLLAWSALPRGRKGRRRAGGRAASRGPGLVSTCDAWSLPPVALGRSSLTTDQSASLLTASALANARPNAAHGSARRAPGGLGMIPTWTLVSRWLDVARLLIETRIVPAGALKDISS